MHELSIVFHIAQSVEDIAKENKVSHVRQVVLEVGEVSMVVNPYLIDCWNWKASKSEVLKGCELKVETIKAITHCDACGKDYPTVEHGKTCPFCGSGETYLLKGDEIEIKEISVDDE